MISAAFRYRHALALLMFVVVAALVYEPLLRPGQIPYSPHSDVVANHLGAKNEAWKAVHQCQSLPLWRTDQYAGEVGFTNPIASYNNPLHFLFYLMPPTAAMGPTFWLELFVMAISFYLLAGSLGLAMPARVFMALAGLLQFKIIIAVYAGWLGLVAGMAVLPLAFASVFMMGRKPSARAALWMALAGLLCLHHGGLQLTFYAALFCLLYCSWCVIAWRKEGGWHLARRGTAWTTIAVVAALMTWAYMLAPAFVDVANLTRGSSSIDFFFSGHAFSARHFLTFIHPEVLGTPLDKTYESQELWEDVAYFGLLPLFLAFVGAIMGRRRRETGFLSVAFLLSVALSMDTPLIRLCFAHVPGMGIFRIPTRFLFFTSVFGIALAGVGIQELLDAIARRTRRWMLLGLILALVVIEGTMYARRYIVTLPAEDVQPKSDYRPILGNGKEPFRVAPLGREVFNYGWASSMGLQLITGSDGYFYNQYQQYFDLLRFGEVRPPRATNWLDLWDIKRPDLLDALNVRYLLSPRLLKVPPERLRLVALLKNEPTFLLYRGLANLDVYVYENRFGLARAFWAEAVVDGLDSRSVLMEAQRHNLRTTALVEGKIPKVSGRSVTDSVTIEAWRSGLLTLKTITSAPRYLVISEVWNPGWRASVDGKPAALLRTDVSLLGLWVPAGSHNLVVSYSPPGWPEALWITACGCLAIGFIGIMAARERRHTLSN